MTLKKTRDLFLLLALCVFSVWLVGALTSAIRLEQKLSGEARSLQQDNDNIAAQNDGYRKDISSLSSGAGAEEDARMNGYAKSGEQVIVIVQPTPSPSPPPSVKASQKP